MLITCCRIALRDCLLGFKSSVAQLGCDVCVAAMAAAFCGSANRKRGLAIS